jgi:hypothetical protein
MIRTTQQLRLELLEDRRLLTTCHVGRLGDVGAGNDASSEHSRGDLRYCINKVNYEPGPDVIDISATGTINLTRPLPLLASDIEIRGRGAELVTVRRQSGGDYVVFMVATGATVTMSGLTISNGSTVFGDQCGGGILNYGTLAVVDAVISGNNSTRDGAGICNINGVATLESSSVTANTLSGIFNSGTFTINNSNISGNSGVPYGGGGIKNFGGILTVNDSFITDNAAGSGGGGIANGAIAIINNTVITGNSISGNIGGDGGGIYNGHILTVANSTISGNTVDSASGTPRGGGISNLNSATIINCTIVDNSVVDGPGGGVYSDGELAIYNSTMSLNSATTGGGIHVVAPMSARNTIIAGNTADTGPDVFGDLGSIGYNMIGNTSGGSGFTMTDWLNFDPMLGPLQDNGGFTQTMALLPGSPAVDVGDNTDAPEWDQRGSGFPRVVNGIIDIGAFEVQATGIPSSGDYVVLMTAELSDTTMIGRIKRRR